MAKKEEQGQPQAEAANADQSEPIEDVKAEESKSAKKAEAGESSQAEAAKASKSKEAKEEASADQPEPDPEAKSPESDQVIKAVTGLIGKKLGMTQVFDEEGRAVPVTVIQAGPCVVVQKKTLEREGYGSLQLGLVEKAKYRANKPVEGHFKKAGVPPTRHLKEFAFSENEGDSVKVGDQILVQNVFRADDRVNVSGLTIGRGFQGVMKRHGFSGGQATHGSMFHRKPGSIGASAYPSRVMPGMKGPGRMGNQKVQTRNLRVVQVDQENHLLVIKGAVPGSTGGYVTITLA